MTTDTAETLCAAAAAIAGERLSTPAEWANALGRMRDLRDRFARLHEQGKVGFADRIRFRDLGREFDRGRKAAIVSVEGPSPPDRGPMTPEALAQRRTLIEKMRRARSIEEAQGIDRAWKVAAGRVDGVLLGEWLGVKAEMVQRVASTPRRGWLRRWLPF